MAHLKRDLNFEHPTLEDETRYRHRNAKRNPNRNQATILLGLFSFEILKRDLEVQFPDSNLDFVLHFDDHFESHLFRNGLYGMTRLNYFCKKNERGGVINFFLADWPRLETQRMYVYQKKYIYIYTT